MAATYTPSQWKGPHFEKVYAEALYANSTVDQNLVQFIPNIKTEIQLKSASGAPVVQDYTANPTTPQGSFNIADRTLKPGKKLIHDRFDPNQILPTVYSEDMAAGAAQTQSQKYMREMEGYLIPRIGKATEASFWAGIVDELVASGPAIDLQGAALTVSTVLDRIKAVYAALPGQVLSTEKPRMFLDESAKQLVLIANADREYRDLLTVSPDGKTIKYLNIELCFVPLKRADGSHAGTILAGDSMDFVWGTDLLSDDASMEVNKVTNEGDIMFYKVVFTQGSAVLSPAQKVISVVTNGNI